MPKRERAIRSGGPGGRIRKVLSIERLESRAVLSGLVNLGESLLEFPAASDRSPSAIVAPMEPTAAEVAVVERTPPPSEPALPSSAPPEVGDPVLGSHEDRENTSGEDFLGQPADDPDCSDDPFQHEDECPAINLESGASYMGSQDSLLQVAGEQSNGSLTEDVGGRDQPMIYFREASLSDRELKSSMLIGTSTARLIDAALPFRYFTDSGDLHRDGWMTLKSEPLAPYATGDTFVAFELIDAQSPHEVDELRSDSQRPWSRRIAFHTELPSAESMQVEDRAVGATPATIAAAEAAIHLAQRIADEADAVRAVSAPGTMVATVAESAAVPTIAFTAPASSCDAAQPDRQAAISLPRSLRFGLLGVASIVISMRASAVSSLRKQMPDHPARGGEPTTKA